MTTYSTTSDAIRKVAEKFKNPKVTCALNQLFPGVLTPFYTGARFTKNGVDDRQYLVVHAPYHKRQYYLVDMKTGYATGVSFTRPGKSYKLEHDEGFLSDYTLVHPGEVRDE